MTRPPRSALKLAPLESVPPEAVVGFVEEQGVARYLTERPYQSGSRCEYPLSLILADAACDDAAALAALRDEEVTGVIVLRYPDWDREHFGYVVARVEHLQGADEEVSQCLADESVWQLGARAARMCSARLFKDALASSHCFDRPGASFVDAERGADS